MDRNSVKMVIGRSIGIGIGKWAGIAIGISIGKSNGGAYKGILILMPIAIPLALVIRSKPKLNFAVKSMFSCIVTTNIYVFFPAILS